MLFPLTAILQLINFVISDLKEILTGDGIEAAFTILVNSLRNRKCR